jgi:hypothetical protein
MAKGRARQIGPGLDRVAILNSSFEDNFVPDWDKGTALGQAQMHLQPRVDMGNKMTPKLGGVMTPARGAQQKG